jgi:hypothetical protein
MCGAIIPLPHTSSWCGALLNTGTTLFLPLLVSFRPQKNKENDIFIHCHWDICEVSVPHGSQ